MPSRKKEPQTQRQYYTILEVCTMLNLSRSKVHDLIENEHLPVEKFGAALRVPMEPFQRWLAQRRQQGS